MLIVRAITGANIDKLIIEVPWHSSENNFTANAQAIILYNEVEGYTFEITATYPRGQFIMLIVVVFIDIIHSDTHILPTHMAFLSSMHLLPCISEIQHCMCVSYVVIHMKHIRIAYWKSMV